MRRRVQWWWACAMARHRVFVAATVVQQDPTPLHRRALDRAMAELRHLEVTRP